MEENYNNFLNNIPSICNNIINKTYNQYCESILYFKDAFHFKYQNEILISQMGFPLDNLKLEKIYDLFYDELESNNKIEEGKYSVNIIPMQYSPSNSSIYKKVNGYKIIVEFKQKETYLQKK